MLPLRVWPGWWGGGRPAPHAELLQWFPRSQNAAADFLAKQASEGNALCVFVRPLLQASRWTSSDAAGGKQSFRAAAAVSDSACIHIRIRTMRQCLLAMASSSAVRSSATCVAPRSRSASAAAAWRFCSASARWSSPTVSRELARSAASASEASMPTPKIQNEGRRAQSVYLQCQLLRLLPVLA